MGAPLRRTFAWTAVFAVTMAYVESAVVVGLRQIYYPDGFRFPIRIIPDAMAVIEVGREAATIGMLLAVGALAGRDLWDRFLWFCLTFGVWDVFYYVWLYVFLGWPPSLLTWDILFLIPVPWIGPVLAPLLVAVSMAACSGLLLILRARGTRLAFGRAHWIAAVTGGLIVLISFMIDFQVVMEGEMPRPFRWEIFGAGMALALGAFADGARRLERPARPTSSAS